MTTDTMIDWSAAEIADLKRLWGEGHSASEIRRQLHSKHKILRSRSAVCGKVSRLGLDKRVTPSRPVRIASAADRSLSDKRRAAGQQGAAKRSGRGFRFGAGPEEPSPERKAGLGKDRIRNPRLLAGQTPSDGRPITELRDRECRYALTADAPHRFCGRTSAPGKSYCAGHLKGLYQAGPAPGNPHARETEKD